MADRLGVVCPCCQTKLVVDGVSGEVLAEERPPVAKGASFEDAMARVRGGTARREEAFAQAVDRTKRLDDLLNKKFEEARKKAKDDPSKPPSPFDAD